MTCAWQKALPDRFAYSGCSSFSDGSGVRDARSTSEEGQLLSVLHKQRSIHSVHRGGPDSSSFAVGSMAGCIGGHQRLKRTIKHLGVPIGRAILGTIKSVQLQTTPEDGKQRLRLEHCDYNEKVLHPQMT